MAAFKKTIKNPTLINSYANTLYLLLLKSNAVFINENRDLDAKNIAQIMFNYKSAFNKISNHLIIPSQCSNFFGKNELNSLYYHNNEKLLGGAC